MNKENKIEERHELSESIYMSGHGLDWQESDDIADQLYAEGYRKQSENTIELPCKAGDEIWYIDKNYIIQKAEVTSISIRTTSRQIIVSRYVWETEETIKLALMFEHLNIDYWLTKEEAEKALAKMKGGTE